MASENSLQFSVVVVVVVVVVVYLASGSISRFNRSSIGGIESLLGRPLGFMGDFVPKIPLDKTCFFHFMRRFFCWFEVLRQSVCESFRSFFIPRACRSKQEARSTKIDGCLLR